MQSLENRVERIVSGSEQIRLSEADQESLRRAMADLNAARDQVQPRLQRLLRNSQDRLRQRRRGQ